MATSARWKNLDREVRILRQQFLPTPFDPLGYYQNQSEVIARTRAFLILCHAEIEWYLEEWAKDLARRSEILWTTSSKVSKPLAYLIATHAERPAVPELITGTSTKDSNKRMADAAVKLFDKFYKLIRQNNGIKERNILFLFSPLGVPASAMGSTLLPNLDSLGEVRGYHAHQSRKAVQNVPDPEVEFKRVASVLTDLGQLDNWLIAYKGKIR